MPRARRSGGNISAAAAREEDDRLGRATEPEPDEDDRAGRRGAARGRDERAGDAEREAPADDGHPTDLVGQAPGGADGQCTRDEEHRRPEAEDARDSGDSDDRHRAERDGELDHSRLEDEPQREQQGVAVDRRHGAITACSDFANSAAPP